MDANGFRAKREAVRSLPETAKQYVSIRHAYLDRGFDQIHVIAELAAWNIFTDMLETKCEREATYFAEVEPEGTTKECAQCGVETDKPLWVREHSCLACGFKADRDANAAWNILSRGLTDLGVGHSELPPVETALAVDTAVVSAKRVVETGSPCLKEPPKAASRQG